MARMIDADALKTAVDDEWCPDMMVSEIWDVIDHAPTIDGWISVKDRLPEESGDVLVYNGHFYVVSFSKQWEAFNHFDFLGKPDKMAYVMTDVTHWMPLPKPPEEVTGDV